MRAIPRRALDSAGPPVARRQRTGAVRWIPPPSACASEEEHQHSRRRGARNCRSPAIAEAHASQRLAESARRSKRWVLAPDRTRSGRANHHTEPSARLVSPTSSARLPRSTRSLSLSRRLASRDRVATFGSSRSAGARAAPRLCVRPGGEAFRRPPIGHSWLPDWNATSTTIRRRPHCWIGAIATAPRSQEARPLPAQPSPPPHKCGCMLASTTGHEPLAHLSPSRCFRLERTRSVCGASGLGGLGFLDGRPAGGGE